jgi:DNA-binding MarR family transcriptional regulator
MQSNRDLTLELQNVIIQFRKENMFKHNHSKIKGAEKHIMFLICNEKKNQPVTISEIAARLGVTLPAVTHQINTLEQQGLIKRLSRNGDRRIVTVELTKKGHEQVAKLKKEFINKTQILADFLGKKDTEDLIRLVKKMSGFGGFTK